MDSLFIKGTEFTPEIKFDIQNHVFEISGFSRPEDVRNFYNNFFVWIDNNEFEIKKFISSDTTLLVVFKLVYFNSASSKCLLDMLLILKKLYDDNILIEWHYEEGDEDLLEAGEEFANAVELNFKYVEIVED